MKGGLSSQFSTTTSELASLPSEAKESSVDRFVNYVQAVGVLQGLILFRRICTLSVLAWVPSMATAYLVHLLFPAQTNPNIFGNAFQVFIGAFVVAPLIETLAMRYAFLVLRKFARRHVVLAALSALMWIPLHAAYAGWGVHAAWPFFVLGLCYLSLEPLSLWRAIWVTSLIHAGCNALSYGLSLLLDLLGLS
jgi:hypothetical protein